MADPVPKARARQRAAELRALSARLWLRYLEAQVGRQTWAVVLFRRRQGRLTAFSEQGIPLSLDGPDSLMGRLVPVVLAKVSEDGMAGELLLR